MAQFIDITGQRFGKLLVIGRAPNNPHGHTSWNCLCDCGRTTVAIGQGLKSGNKISCGCSRIKNISGQKFNMLTAIEVIGSKDCAIWRCLCDCGNYRDVRAPMLRADEVYSCGCTTRDGRKRHGKSRHYLYATYIAMRQRCENPNNRAYPDYGGRGIRVCDRWANGDEHTSGFDLFLADMGDRPEGMTIDRIDADKGYEPNNCRWATYKTQSQNRRSPIRNRHTRGLLRAVDDLLASNNPVNLHALRRAREAFEHRPSKYTPANDNSPHRKTA